MTGDELAIAARKRQGFLVIGSWVPRRIGEILRKGNVPADTRQTETPLVIVAEATRAEYEAQNVIFGELLGKETVSFEPIDQPHFYRVEAAD